MRYITAILAFVLQIISGKSSQFLIPNIVNPQQVIWLNDFSVLLVSDSPIEKLNIITKDTELVGQRLPNEFVGLDERNNIILCKFENFLISSKDQYSTTFTIDGKVMKFFPTIRPIYLKNNSLIAVTSIDFLEKHYYKIDIKTGYIEEIARPENIKNTSRYIESDVFGNIYLKYNAREIFIEGINKYINIMFEFLLKKKFLSCIL